MKTKIALAVTLGGLFVAVPSAAPKGKPASEQLSVGSCSEVSGGDSCTVTATGLAAGATYRLEVTDFCDGSFEYGSNETPDGGTINQPLVLLDASTGCATPGWTFNLYRLSGKGVPSLVATFVRTD